jgi:two-component system, NtrC family, sensor kinase
MNVAGELDYKSKRKFDSMEKVHLCLKNKSLKNIEGDEDQLRQVFTNLIVNGLQAMETGGTLTVSTVANLEASDCSVTIADNGTGISKELQEKLFSPFFTTKSYGTGLGLAVSYGIVKDHGGDIRVVSEAGLGAEFIVVLPVRQAAGRGVTDA